MTLPAPDLDRLRALIRDVPDFPKPGIVFKDLTPLLADAGAFGTAIEGMATALVPHAPQGLVAIESRGFLFGAALATRLRLPLLLVRKPGKLPHRTEEIEYALEYGRDRLQIHADAIVPGARYAIVDDVLATGGTAAATAALVEKLGGAICACAFLIELGFLEGRALLGARACAALLRY